MVDNVGKYDERAREFGVTTPFGCMHGSCFPRIMVFNEAMYEHVLENDLRSNSRTQVDIGSISENKYKKRLHACFLVVFVVLVSVYGLHI